MIVYCKFSRLRGYHELSVGMATYVIFTQALEVLTLKHFKKSKIIKIICCFKNIFCNVFVLDTLDDEI